eukprot:5656599-Pyramimonas_sp.AAC.1
MSRRHGTSSMCFFFWHAVQMAELEDGLVRPVRPPRQIWIIRTFWAHDEAGASACQRSEPSCPPSPSSLVSGP